MATQFTEIRLDSLLLQAREMGAEDIHLQAGSPPLFRVFGDLKARQNKNVSMEALYDLLGRMLEPEQLPLLEKQRRLRWVHWASDDRLVRCQASKWPSGCTLTLRLLREEPLPLEELGWDSHLPNLLEGSGLILLTGHAGSGVSTTLASLVNLLNMTSRQHILCLEHDLEIMHPYKLSMINQRCFDRDFDCWKQAVGQAARQEVDTLVLHDAPLKEVWSELCSFLDGGGLALVTMRASSVYRALESLPDFYPPAEQQWVRPHLSRYLAGATHQRLVTGKQARYMAGALLTATLGIRNLLLENKLRQLSRAMASNPTCRTLEQSLCLLVQDGTLRAEEALAVSDYPEELKSLLAGGAS